MINEQILKKAIEKAVKNRWEHNYKFSDKSWHYLLYDKGFYKIIFSHSFAEAFYPKGWICYKGGEWQDCEESQTLRSETPFVYPKFIYHLMKSVQEEEPLKYIEKFL